MTHFTREQRDDWHAITAKSPFNRWLRARVNRRDGTLDLDKLDALAVEYGIDISRYAHLNPGQKRMNIGNRLRKLVPESAYLESVKSDSALLPQTPAPVSPVPAVEPAAVRQPSLAGLGVRELLGLHASVIDELRARGVARTGNSPLGDYAEHLCAKAFGWTLSANSSAGFDASDAAGLRFEVKARRLRLEVPGERQLSALRALPEARFDFLAAVLFGPDFSVRRAALIPHAVVLAQATHIAHVNGWRLMLQDSLWDLPGVRDITKILSRAAAA